MLYAIHLVILFTISTGTDTGNIYKKKEGSKRVGGWGIYIVNLVAKLIDIYHTLL